jgi:hypothetical protein
MVALYRSGMIQRPYYYYVQQGNISVRRITRGSDTAHFHLTVSRPKSDRMVFSTIMRVKGDLAYRREKKAGCRRASSSTVPDDFGTYVLQKTGNIAAVMNSMGHSDVKTAMTYQHPELNFVRDAINSRHTLRHTAEM